MDSRLSALDDKIDRRVEAVEVRIRETNGRIDLIISNQGTAQRQLATLEADLNRVQSRVERVYEKLLGTQ
jgi:hypothetical protein